MIAAALGSSKSKSMQKIGIQILQDKLEEFSKQK